MIKDALRQFFVYGVGNIAQTALSFFLLPILLRFFEPSEYGVISLLSVATLFLALFANLGVGTALFRLYYEAETAERRKLVGTTWLWYLFSASLGGAILFTQATWLSRMLFDTGDYSYAIKLLGAFFFFSLQGDIPFSVLRLEGKAGFYVGFSLFRFAIDFALKLYFIAFLGRGISGYFEAGIIAYVATLCTMIPFALRYVTFSLNTSYLKQLLRLGFPFVFSGIALWILTVSDRLILDHFRGEAAVGIYSLAYSFAGLLDVFLTSPSALFWGPFFFSYAAKMPAEDAKRLLNKSLVYFFIAGSVLYLAISLGSGDVLRAFTFLFAAKKEYHQAATLVPLLTLGPLLYLLGRQAGNAMLMAKKPEFTAIASSIAAGVNLGLNFVFIPRFGAWGAAMNAVIAYALQDILCYWWAQRVWPVNYDWKGVARGFLFLGIAFIIGWSIEISYSWASLLTKVIVAVVVFASLSWFAILTRAERDTVLTYLTDKKRKIATMLSPKS